VNRRANVSNDIEGGIQAANNRRIKVGLLGAGYILQAHAKALQATDGVEIRAICDISRERAAEAAAAFDVPLVHGDIAELLGSDCDVVHVLLPPHLHVDVTRRILEAGKSAFVEKPMGLGSEQCQQLVDLAKARGLKLGVNHNFLFLPSYERLRSELHDGTLGPIDHVTVNWLYMLGLLQFGPYNNWMLREPGNLVYELGPHLAAFVVDLLGPVDDLVAVASHPIDLPGHQRVWRHWNAIGRTDGRSLSFNLSVAAGQPERSVHVRCHAGSAHLDFERDFYWRQTTSSPSAVFDPFMTATRDARLLIGQSVRNLVKTVRGTLAKSSTSNVFQESIQRSVATFYRGYRGTLDPRIDGAFGVEVMRLCERIVRTAGVDATRAAAASAAAPATHTTPSGAPTVLVVGGTGFIGKRLVRALVARGANVRVLSYYTSFGGSGWLDPSIAEVMPGDVVTTMSGQTVEVINTDAEGRLVLCDAMTWTQKNIKPKVMIELSTLTGAMVITLGHEYAGFFSNDEKLAASLVKVARLVPAAPQGLPVSALHDGGDVAARVRHLVADPSPSEDPAPRTALRIVTGMALATLALAAATQAWPAVHEMIEVAARLLH